MPGITHKMADNHTLNPTVKAVALQIHRKRKVIFIEEFFLLNLSKQVSNLSFTLNILAHRAGA